MAQRVRPQATKVEQDISLETSVQTVKLLIETGIGCITYLRGLLPDENFEDVRISAPRLGPAPPSDRPPTSSQSDDKKKGIQSVKVKQIARGYSSEADKILDWIELGAVDALEKSYLHQLVFAIYLDPDNPTNVVECYTFTISYEKDEHGQKKPEMVVRDQLSGMVISGVKQTVQGSKTVVKEDDAKRQVQKLIKNLITNTASLDELPRRRFITVRLYYTEDTPADYEPPLFRPFFESNPHFQLTTSQVDEAPDIQALGALHTGFHGVTLHVAHIAPLLEVAPDVRLSPPEAIARNQLDALTRPVVWDAMDLVEQRLLGAPIQSLAPVGVRDSAGALRSLEDVELGKCGDELRDKVGLGDFDDRHKILGADQTKRRVEKAVDDNAALAVKDPIGADSQQAPLLDTQPEPVVSRVKSIRPAPPPVPLFDETPEEYSRRRATSQTSGSSQDLLGSTEVELAAATPPTGLESVQEAEDEDDLYDTTPTTSRAQGHAFPSSSASSVAVQLGEETQLLFQDTTMDQDDDHPAASPLLLSGSLAESSRSNEMQDFDNPMATPKGNPVLQTPMGTAIGTWAKAVGRETTCECGDKDDDEAMLGCSACLGWKHAVCYGYYSADDARLPADFFCWPCRVVLGVSDALLHPEREAEVYRALDELGDLALFRRAIATIWQDGVLNSADLSLRLSVETATTAQIIKRLTREKFLIEERVEAQTQTQTASGSKARKARQSSKVYQKTRVVVNKSPGQLKIKDETYFSPGRGAESGLTMVLDCSDADADGIDDTRSRNASFSRDDPTGPLPKLAAPPTATDEDPIVTSDDEGAAGAPVPKGSSLKGKEKERGPAYVPHFGSKAGAPTSKSDFHRASSILPDPNEGSMDVDADSIEEGESLPEPDTLEGSQWSTPVPANNKRPTEVDHAADAAANESDVGRGKRKKKTRGSEVEGPVEVA